MPSMAVAALSYAVIAFAILRSVCAKAQPAEYFWPGFAIASICYIAYLYLNPIEGYNALMSHLSFVVKLVNPTTDTWHAFHVANLVENWLVPVVGTIGGMVAERFGPPDLT
jgi:hypothetical protein